MSCLPGLRQSLQLIDAVCLVGIDAPAVFFIDLLTRLFETSISHSLASPFAQTPPWSGCINLMHSGFCLRLRGRIEGLS